MRLLALLLTVSLPVALWADTIHPKSGEPIYGIIQKIEKGRVTIAVGNMVRQMALADIEEIDFDTPHLTEGTAKLPLKHFLEDLDAQEMVRISEDLKNTRQQLHTLLNRAKTDWNARGTIEKDELPAWEAAKEQFRAPLFRYREVMHDLYYHVLANVDDYNRLAHDASQVHVGVKGAFSVGSRLLPEDFEELQPKDFLPSTWYDRIYYEGYRRGYRDAEDYQTLLER
jgi:hypothetical protein